MFNIYATTDMKLTSDILLLAGTQTVHVTVKHAQTNTLLNEQCRTEYNRPQLRSRFFYNFGKSNQKSNHCSSSPETFHSVNPHL